MDFRITLEGTGALLMHNARLSNPLDPAAKAIKKVSGKRNKTEDDHAEMAHLEFIGSLYYDPDAGPFVPGDNIWRALYDGAKKSKRGVKVKEGLLITTDVNPLAGYGGPGRRWTRLVGGRELPALRVSEGREVRVTRCRPMFRTWKVEADGMLDTNVLDFAELEQIAETAGLLMGLGDWRPRFGRYTATVKRTELGGQVMARRARPAWLRGEARRGSGHGRAVARLAGRGRGRVTGRHRGSSPRHPRRAGLGLAGLARRCAARPGKAWDQRRHYTEGAHVERIQAGRRAGPMAGPLRHPARRGDRRVVTYEELGEALGLDRGKDRHVIQMAMRRAAQEHEREDKRASTWSRTRATGCGTQDLRLARGTRKGRPVTGAWPVQGRQCGPVRRGPGGAPRAGDTAQAFALQMDFNRRFAVRQTGWRKPSPRSPRRSLRTGSAQRTRWQSCVSGSSGWKRARRVGLSTRQGKSWRGGAWLGKSWRGTRHRMVWPGVA